MNTEKKHARVSGSIIRRLIACPWSLANSHRAIPQPASSAAEEGTALHSVVEMYFLGRIPDLKELAEVSVEGVTMTEERLADAQKAIDLTEAYLDELESQVGEETKLWVEQPVSFGSVIPEASGTCDLLVRCGKVLAMIDFKFGRNPVDADRNSQLMFYAQAARHTIPELRECQNIELHIIQPRAVISHGQSCVTVEDLVRFERQIQVTIHEAEGPNPRCVSGDHCKYCPLEFICPEKQTLAEEALQMTALPVDVEALTYWLDHKEEIESFLSSVRTTALRLLENGCEVEGYKLVARRANRTWVNPDEVIRYCQEHGLGEEDYLDIKLVSPAKLEKILKKVPSEFTKKISSGTTVAPRSDRRVDLNEHNFGALKKFQAESGK